jgi:hypothetical protein
MIRFAVAAFALLLAGALAAQDKPPPAPERSPRAAIAAGVQWLVAHQEENGGWSAGQFMRHDPKGDLCTGPGKPDQDLRVTALAILALQGSSSTLGSGPHTDALHKAQEWLGKQLHDGFLGEPSAANAIASHAIGCLAMRDVASRRPAQSATEPLQRLLRLRLPDGTWPARGGLGTGDVDATYWACVACLFGAEDAKLPWDLQPTLQAIEQGKLGPSVPSAIEAQLRVFARAADGRLAELVRKIDAHPPRWPDAGKPGDADFLAWMLGTQALYWRGGDTWSKSPWRTALEGAALPRQRTDGASAGSWDPVDARGKDGGRVYATAAIVLALESYNRVGRVLK